MGQPTTKDDETTADHGPRGRREEGAKEPRPRKGSVLTHGGLDGRPKRQPTQFRMMVGPQKEAHAGDGEDHDDTSKGEDDPQCELLTDVHPNLPDQIDGQTDD